MYSSSEIVKKLNGGSLLKRFKENNVKHLYLAGSYSRGEENENSDIDLIYELNQSGYVSGFSFIEMKLNLENELNINVDLVERDFINKNLKEYVEKDKILIF